MYRQIQNCMGNLEIPQPVKVDAPLEVILEESSKLKNVKSPEVWGESFWFVVHLGSISAPEFIPVDKRYKYWGFIDGIPEMLACGKCSKHAREWVEQHRQYQDQICSSRDNLVKFYVDMHNNVNIRNGKPVITVDEVYRKFSGMVKIKTFKYQ